MLSGSLDVDARLEIEDDLARRGGRQLDARGMISTSVARSGPQAGSRSHS
jgi:hypothetical protein